MPAVTSEAPAVPALTHLLFLQQLGLGLQEQFAAKSTI